MAQKKREIVVFDFDGTLTTRDTLLLFIHYAVGTRRFLIGFLIFSPLILLMKLGLYDNGRCKERVFSWFFRGISHERFCALGRGFSIKAQKVARQSTTEALAHHIRDGATVYVITASVEEWVRPYCERIGVDKVLGTKVEVNSNGQLTGRFSTPNCYGAEKVRRLLAAEPDRDTYRLTAYGDSGGDAEMFAMADEHFKV